MDRSKTNFENQIAAIKASILDGSLTHAQMRRILTSEIDKELNKPVEEVDMGYVNACQSFLECINPQKASLVESHFESNYTAIRAKLYPARKPTRRRKVLRVVIATVCVMAMLFTTDILLTQRSIDTSISQNHEQVIVQGTVVSPGTIDKADACIKNGEILNLCTKSWSEAVAFLGFEPSLPTWLPQGWKADEYICDILAEFSEILVSYSNPESKELLQYAITYYRGSGVVQNEFEKDVPDGEKVTINNAAVYLTNNMGSRVALWTEDEAMFSISGPVAQEDIVRMVQSIESRESNDER
ncbi:MAG: DUF4367 domain-containing protein [Clostridia bacterium]